MLRSILRFIAEYFVFFAGLLFIFIVGLLYAYLHLEGLVINIVFLLIVVGWTIFLIKYFWELMEKKKNKE